MFFLVTAITVTLLMGLFLFGRLGTTEQDFHKKLSIQSEYFTKNMESYWDDLASMNIALGETMQNTLETNLEKQGLTFSQLQDNPNALYALENDMIQPLGQYLERSNCSGAYVQLDTTINSTLIMRRHNEVVCIFKNDNVLFKGRLNFVSWHRKYRKKAWHHATS